MAADADQKTPTMQQGQTATIGDALDRIGKAEQELDAALGILANAYARKRSLELLNFMAMTSNAHQQIVGVQRQAVNDKITERG